MKIGHIHKENIYELIPRINIVLSASALILAAFFVVTLTQPYNTAALRGKNIKPRAIELPADGDSQASEGIPPFDESIFRKKPLFGLPTIESHKEVKKTFLLLGVSMGDKKIAIIRDTEGNKNYYCSEGDTIGNFRVTQIHKSMVLIESDEKTLEITQ